jgi:ATP-dependent exoDNAse (exonuclease V) alpha subunit
LHEDGDEPTPRGARLLYVAITRAVQRVEFVTDAGPPAVISPDRSA